MLGHQAHREAVGLPGSYPVAVEPAPAADGPHEVLQVVVTGEEVHELHVLADALVLRRHRHHGRAGAYAAHAHAFRVDAVQRAEALERAHQSIYVLGNDPVLRLGLQPGHHHDDAGPGEGLAEGDDAALVAVGRNDAEVEEDRAVSVRRPLAGRGRRCPFLPAGKAPGSPWSARLSSPPTA